MIRLLRPLLVAAVVLTACSPTLSGPIPPRPSEAFDGIITTTTQPATTTTAATVASESVQAVTECPTPFCLVYHIDPQARWSDGSPVTPEDLAHTVSVSRGKAEAQPGYSRVSRVETIDEQTALVVFDRPYGGWQRLFGRVIRAGEQHADLDDFSTTGPFRLLERDEGNSVTIARDPDWWASEDPLSGSPLGDVQQITFVFIAEPLDMVDALSSGTVDVIAAARPDAPTVERLANLENVEYTLSPGPFWEHIDFHHEDPLLSQDWVREALTLAIDRNKILDRTVRLIDPNATTLDSTVFMSETVGYEPHFPDGFDAGRAEQILTDNGCSRGEDQIQVCDGTRMSFTWASTDDDPARRETFESVREDLAAIGVELEGDFRTPSAFVTRDFLFGGPDVWQLINFSWRARSEPIVSNPTYYCGEVGDLNVNRYCSQEVESLVRASEETTDPEARMSIYNEADRLYLEDRALIPLYQKPVLMAWTSELQGPEPNYTHSSDLWNVGSWSGRESIVVAIPAEPVDLNPLSESDDSANVVLGALLYGAFGMNPSHEYIPALVESVDVIEGPS